MALLDSLLPSWLSKEFAGGSRGPLSSFFFVDSGIQFSETVALSPLFPIVSQREWEMLSTVRKHLLQPGASNNISHPS